MAKILDLNALEQPVFELKMRDEKHTIFRLTTPTTKLVEQFNAAKGELKELAENHDVDKIKKLYDLTAAILSCNLDFVTVTAEELRDKYHVTFSDIVVIFAGYLDFLNEFNTAKN